MKKPLYGDSDPIAALATPFGESALALIRTTGPGTIELLAKAFSQPKKLISAKGNSIIHGWIINPVDKSKIDDVLVSVFRGPKSYTGEDSADISCHGGIAVIMNVMLALRQAGFREALPGEFTFRAFMNGKLDLTRAESVMELVSAKTGKARELAVRRLIGALEKEVKAIKALLVDVLAGTEIYLDYSEDEFSTSTEDEAAGRLPERALAEQALARLKALARHWHRERVFVDGALAVLAGRPNAGKSSLFNYLLKEERSIVTESPGTTRDWIESRISVSGIPLRLADTAGLREGHENKAEQIGVKRTINLLERADIILYLIDGIKGITNDDMKFISQYQGKEKPKPLIIIWNKTDLAEPKDMPPDLPGKFLAISAKTGEGTVELLQKTTELLSEPPAAGENHRGEHPEDAGPGTVRQKDLIDTSLSCVEEALALADAGEPLDIIAPLFRSAIDALGEITGEVTNGDILDAMFSRFCVGK
ncbi:MAG: tRNA uridine-5-carboxymethylaminomethyl(34) synthesis GTPase MnmE [Treponema sp.]|nr:tRNA uridine-5-carboxymethylaminomethyl(34) synthesis GTPase MnmE [Treponema sp.]